jgi:DNA-binding transcriptional regulator YiaG
LNLCHIKPALGAACRRLGLSRRKTAAELSVDPATLMGWETGRLRPTKKSAELIGKVFKIA